jgi:DNA-binding NtrC family response regulator
MMACSSSMIEAVRLARAYARARDPVVLVGPTGSGKSRLARLIHEWSGRSGHLVEVSARELVESLSSDQLFGHEKGAFTDAIARRLGALASANSGSVLLDDAHLLQDRTQMLLLRALDSGYIRPHGSDRDVPIQVRLLVGTQRGLDELVREGALLPDFRYRLGFFEIRLGALRDRREDIAPLVEHFLSERAGELAAEPLVPGPGLVPMLQLAPWPGNVRELEQALRFADWRARMDGEHQVRMAHFPEDVQRSIRIERGGDREAQDRLIKASLDQCDGNVGRTAELLGLHRNTVTARLRRVMARQGAGSVHSRGDTSVQHDTIRSAAD